jgi:crotonobetainyl-CoA hydratase
MSSDFRVSRNGPILTVTLDRPESLNALHPDVHVHLEKVWDDFAADASLRVGILTGAGDRAFCAGSDLKAYDAGRQPVMPRSGWAGLTNRKLCPKPILAAVNGLAFGGGFEIMLACDLVIAAEHAVFALPEPLVGAAAMAGGIARLCRKIPYAAAMAIVLANQQLTAGDARRLGLVNAVVPKGELLETARRWAEEVVRCAPLGVKVSKKIAERSLEGESLTAICELEDGRLKKEIMSSEDFREGVRAFVEKRPPVWRGN